MAGWKGLEPSTSCVTGRRSSQLNYHPIPIMEPATRLELVTYRLQGGCSTNWATLAQKSSIPELFFYTIKQSRHIWFLSCSISLFDNTYFFTFINHFVNVTQIFNTYFISFFNIFLKFFHCHFHPEFKLMISCSQFQWSFCWFFCWFCDWHSNFQI